MKHSAWVMGIAAVGAALALAPKFAMANGHRPLDHGMRTHTESPRRVLPPRMPAAELLAHETSEMYSYVSKSLVEVHISRDPTEMLPPRLRSRFLAWEKHWVLAHHFRPMRANHYGHRGPTITIVPDVSQPPTGENGQSRSSRSSADAEKWLKNLRRRPIAELFLLQRFLIKLHAFGKPPLMPILQAVHLRIMAFHSGLKNRVYGMVTGRHGHVLVLSLLGVWARGAKVAVTAPGGRTYQATVLGTDFMRAMTELELPRGADVPGIKLSRRLPRQAALTLAFDGGAPGIHWEHLCSETSRTPWRRSANRSARQRIHRFFQIVSVPRFYIDLRGRLTAISTLRASLVAGGKYSLLRTFIQSGFSSGPRFGIKYRLVSPKSALRHTFPELRGRPAALVQAVFPNSPAARAGIRRGDFILSIDGLPITQLHKIIQSARRRPYDIPVELLRQNELLKCTINLLPPHAGQRHAGQPS